MSNGNGGATANQNGGSTRDRVRGAVGDLGDNPVALVAGGVALGVLIGMLIPRAAKERELLDPVGRKLADRASSVAKAAKEAGKQEIDALLPGKDATKERVSALFGNVVNAAKEAARS
jgi:hypothetical protein